MGPYRFVKAVSTRRSDPILQIRQQFSRDACDLVHGDVEHLFVGLRRLAIAGYFTDELEGGGLDLFVRDRRVSFSEKLYAAAHVLCFL